MPQSRGAEPGAAAYTGRFAPSPSGPLHAGSLFAAVIGWLDARAAGGRWLLRIEDIDPPREVAGASDAIRRALERHGLHWDGPVLLQSSRTDAYRAAFEQLDAARELYRCVCSRRRLRETSGGIYPGTCRDLGLTGVGAVRVRVHDAAQTFVDRHYGPIRQDLAREVGDFIIRRRDGLWAYQLAVVVDDAGQGVTDVVRGVDLLDSTPRQIHLQQLLGLPTPRYLHFPVLRRANDGSKLSKQAGAAAVDCSCPERNLARILGWLGMDPEPRAAVTTQLARALEHWSPARLPNADPTIEALP